MGSGAVVLGLTFVGSLMRLPETHGVTSLRNDDCEFSQERYAHLVDFLRGARGI